MKPEEVIAFVNDRVRLGWPFKAWNMGLRAHYAEHLDGVSVAIFVDAPRRDTGKQGGGVHMRFILPHHLSCDMSEADLSDFLRCRLLDMARHEMDESILIDGKRAFDPHAEES